jgi:hypothetical protein
MTYDEDGNREHGVTTGVSALAEKKVSVVHLHRVLPMRQSRRLEAAGLAARTHPGMT